MITQYVGFVLQSAVVTVRIAAALVERMLDWILTLYLPYRYQLFEWCDLWITPPFVKHRCQQTLSAQWTRQLPLLQSCSPAQHAVNLLTQVFANISDSEVNAYTVIDFCSGAGGPTPEIERSINARRDAAGLNPIQFRMTDLYPDIDNWIEVSSHSDNLSFIPQAVDATNPPASTISITARESMQTHLDTEYRDEEVSVTGKIQVNPRMEVQRNADRKRAKKDLTADTKIVHLYCLSFHHFGDEDARSIITSTLQNSDAFVILELQERTLGCLAMLALEPILLLLVTWVWFWGDWSHLFFTYVIPILPLVHGWDGLVSCLRTRTFVEMRTLIDQALAQQRIEIEKGLVLNGQPDGRAVDEASLEWTISEARIRHTWPAGWLNATVGIRSDVRRETR